MLENVKANIKTHVVPLKIILLGTLFSKTFKRVEGGFYFGFRIGYWGSNIALFVRLKGMFVMTRFMNRLSSLAKYVRQKCLLPFKSLTIILENMQSHILLQSYHKYKTPKM